MVVSDVRFDNEADWVRSIGGLVIHIIRGSAPDVAAHSSEQGVTMRPGDGTIVNDGTLQDLYTQIDFLANNTTAGTAVA